MRKPGPSHVDLLLEGNWPRSNAAVAPMTLLDAPKVDPEQRKAGFAWMPILGGIAAMLLLLVAVAYL